MEEERARKKRQSEILYALRHNRAAGSWERHDGSRKKDENQETKISMLDLCFLPSTHRAAPLSILFPSTCPSLVCLLVSFLPILHRCDGFFESLPPLRDRFRQQQLPVQVKKIKNKQTRLREETGKHEEGGRRKKRQEIVSTIITLHPNKECQKERSKAEMWIPTCASLNWACLWTPSVPNGRGFPVAVSIMSTSESRIKLFTFFFFWCEDDDKDDEEEDEKEDCLCSSSSTSLWSSTIAASRGLELSFLMSLLFPPVHAKGKYFLMCSTWGGEGKKKTQEEGEGRIQWAVGEEQGRQKRRGRARQYITIESLMSKIGSATLSTGYRSYSCPSSHATFFVISSYREDKLGVSGHQRERENVDDRDFSNVIKANWACCLQIRVIVMPGIAEVDTMSVCRPSLSQSSPSDEDGSQTELCNLSSSSSRDHEEIET